MSLETVIQELVEVVKQDIAVRRDFLNAFKSGHVPAECAASPATEPTAAPVEEVAAPAAEPEPAAPESQPAERAEEPMSQKEYSAQCSFVGARWKEAFGVEAAKVEFDALCARYGVKNSLEIPPEKRRQFLADVDQLIIEARHDR